MHCELAMLARVISSFQKNWQYDIGRGSSLLGAHALPARPVIRPGTVWEEICERSFELTTFFYFVIYVMDSSTRRVVGFLPWSDNWTNNRGGWNGPRVLSVIVLNSPDYHAYQGPWAVVPAARPRDTTDGRVVS